MSDFKSLQLQYESLQNDYNNLSNSSLDDISSLEDEIVSLNNQIAQLQARIQSQQSIIDNMNNGVNFNQLVWTIASVPFDTFTTIWNVDFLGVNIASVITGLLTGLILIWLLKKIF